MYATTDIESPYVKDELTQGNQVVHLKWFSPTIGFSGINEVFPNFFA